MNEYIRIVKENNGEPYLFYQQSVNWNIERISKQEKANGYIVQEVEITNSTGIPDIDEYIHYYEAWLVKDGKCVYDDDLPDDSFRGGYEEVRDMMIGKSLGKTGEVKYTCKIYWVDKTDKHYNIVDKWEENSVVHAGKLKAVLASDCPEFADIEPVVIRDPFVHKVDFTDKEIIKKSIVECYAVRINKEDEFLQCDLVDLLEGTPYVDLAKEICIENNLAYDMI